MEGTSCTARVEPAIGAAAAHLAIDNYTLSPRAMAFVAVFTWRRGYFASNMCKEGLDVASPLKIENLLHATLLGMAHAGLAGEALTHGTIDNKVIATLACHLLGGLSLGIRAS